MKSTITASHATSTHPATTLHEGKYSNSESGPEVDFGLRKQQFGSKLKFSSVVSPDLSEDGLN